jgi:hypothetical protein
MVITCGATGGATMAMAMTAMAMAMSMAMAEMVD